MSIFNFLLKKSKLVSNKSLVPVLTKNIVEVILENYDDLELIISFDEDPPEYDDPSLMYSVDKYSCYSDSSGIIYGWIIVQRGEFDIRVNLIKYFPKDNNYISLFDFDFTGGIVGDCRFVRESSLYKYENSTQQCMDAIKRYANFNAYQTSPPYVLFANMIDLTK